MDRTFNDLQDRITRLKSEKEALDREIRTDKIELSTLEDKIRTKKQKIEYDGNALGAKEAVIKEYDTIISESLKTYDKIISNATFLTKALNNENSELQRRLQKCKIAK